MKKKNLFSRRTTLKGIGAIGASAIFGAKTAFGVGGKTQKADLSHCSGDIRKTIFDKVSQTPFIDTHEHLLDESVRLANAHGSILCDDWTILLCQYTNNNMLTAGMPKETYDKFFSSKVDPLDKWALLEPYWPAIKNTGYGQVVRITLKELYDVDELSGGTVKKVQAGYEKVRRPGFYKYILQDLANIESCQVDRTVPPFYESEMPTFLMQDLSILYMIANPTFKPLVEPTGIKVSCLSDYHKVIDWWFAKYGRYEVAVKSQQAYNRDIDHEKVAAEKVEQIFKKKISKQPITDQEKKALEDHVFWYAVGKADEFKLPVKLHTGYYYGYNKMPLSRLASNPGSASDICRLSPETRFIFMHIGYPYYEPMIALAKHYTNAYIDMCFAWMCNPIASKDFLKKYLVTAPANKILTFGGDYGMVEPVLWHAVIARRGIALALSELVEEGWMSLDNAMELIDPIMHGNARQIFNLAEKDKILKNVKWG